MDLSLEAGDPCEEHSETCSEKKAEFESKIDYRIKSILLESVEREEEEVRRKFVSHLVQVVQTCNNEIPTTHLVMNLRI